MPYTGRPRGSSGPVPLIVLGIIFGAVGVATMNQPFGRSIAVPFIALGAVMLLGGIAWAGYRLQRARQGGGGAWSGQWTTPLGGSTTSIDLRGQGLQPPTLGGIPARASIHAVRDLGPGGPGQRLYELDLMVTPSGRAPYPLTNRSLVPVSSVSRLVVGGSVPAQVDPSDPSRIAVEWHAP